MANTVTFKYDHLDCKSDELCLVDFDESDQNLLKNFGLLLGRDLGLLDFLEIIRKHSKILLVKGWITNDA